VFALSFGADVCGEALDHRESRPWGKEIQPAAFGRITSTGMAETPWLAAGPAKSRHSDLRSDSAAAGGGGPAAFGRRRLSHCFLREGPAQGSC